MNVRNLKYTGVCQCEDYLNRRYFGGKYTNEINDSYIIMAKKTLHNETLL